MTIDGIKKWDQLWICKENYIVYRNCNIKTLYLDWTEQNVGKTIGISQKLKISSYVKMTKEKWMCAIEKEIEKGQQLGD